MLFFFNLHDKWNQNNKNKKKMWRKNQRKEEAVSGNRYHGIHLKEKQQQQYNDNKNKMFGIQNNVLLYRSVHSFTQYVYTYTFMYEQH